MAKKKESIYKTWEEVDKAIKRLGELYIEKQDIEGKLTIRYNELKAYGNEKISGVASEIKNIEKEIERFANQNKEEFLKTRSKKLNFGTISYRLSKKVVCKCIESAVMVLKTLNLDFLLRTKTELDKDEILKCEDDLTSTLAKANISIVSEDKIRIEPDYVKLAVSERKTGTDD